MGPAPSSVTVAVRQVLSIPRRRGGFPLLPVRIGLAFHDAKLLSENLMANEDWEQAGNAYAVQHDRDFGIIHTFDNWMAGVLCRTGPEADTRQERILPMWHQEPSRNPWTIVNGPSEPLDETARKRFLCED